MLPLVAAAIAAVALGAMVLTRMDRQPRAAAGEPKPALVQQAPPGAARLAPSAPSTPPPAEAAPAAKIDEVAVAKPEPSTGGEEPHPKRHEHEHHRPKPAKNADWGTDPFGNLIPPP